MTPVARVTTPDPAWAETEPVLTFRRALMRDILRALKSDPAQIAQVDQMAGDTLQALEDQIARQTLIPGYYQFWAMQQALGLPDPFTIFPVQSAFSTTSGFKALRINGFGPSLYAFENWPYAYLDSRGMNPGVDYLVPAGSPLVAVADGVIVDFPFLTDPAAQAVALRPYLPGSRTLSNVVVGYGHLLADESPVPPAVGTQVRAGEVIGASGYPVHTQADGDVMVQRHNAQLHLQTHLVTDGAYLFEAAQPFNPLLFFAPRWVAFQARLAQHDDRPPYPQAGQPFSKLGFFELGCFRLQPPTIVWEHTPARDAIWPAGVYALADMITYVAGFAPYTP